MHMLNPEHCDSKVSVILTKSGQSFDMKSGLNASLKDIQILL